MSSVKVAVRVRPFNGREEMHASKSIVDMRGRFQAVHMPARKLVPRAANLQPGPASQLSHPKHTPCRPRKAPPRS